MSTARVPEEPKPTRSLDKTWLVHLAAVLISAVAVALAPDVTKAHPASDLSAFFSSLAQISATLVVAIALFQGPLSDPVAHRVRRLISRAAFLYLGVAVICGVAGSIGSLGAEIYPYLFGVGAGTGTAGLLTVLQVGAANIAEQRASAAAEQGGKLGAD